MVFFVLQFLLLVNQLEKNIMKHSDKAKPETKKVSSTKPPNRFEAEEMEALQKRKTIMSKGRWKFWAIPLLLEIRINVLCLITGGGKDETTWWQPSPQVLQAKEFDEAKTMDAKAQNWNWSFREFRAYADAVLESLRRNGVNAKLILRSIQFCHTL